MTAVPRYPIDRDAFWRDPYPDLKRLRADMPVAFVPELGATLITRRADIFTVEKKIDAFSSEQPEGLMTQLMGQNMMRKDGAAHQTERRAIFPSVSPKTVKTVWKAQFAAFTDQVLDEVRPLGHGDIMDLAKRLSGEALVSMTGLSAMTWLEMDQISQAMIDGCANYAGVPEIAGRCHAATAAVDAHIAKEKHPAPQSLLAVQQAAGLSAAQISANIKLAISGGQNEPRDVIAGLVWALLSHPEQLEMVRGGEIGWMQAFDEYCRWMSPIGMSPREMAKPYELHGVTLAPGSRVFLMFGSANRDESCFARPDAFDVTQDASASIAFGAGPHFCAGAWAARCLVAEVVMPALFARLPGLRLTGDVAFGGWAFRGPLSVPVAWDT